jgi:long-chain acyl-CoA synthetase
MPTFYDRFRECAERWPENICLEIQRQNGMESYTSTQVRRSAESVGRWLVESKFEAGTRCAILADNHPRWVMTYLGVIAAGCTTVPLDTALHPDQIAKLLRDSGAKVLFCGSKQWAAVEKDLAGIELKIILMDVAVAGEGPVRLRSVQVRATAAAELRSAGQPGAAVPTLDSIFSAGPGNFKALDSPEDALASLLYTSGTTADPKGVMLTHANLLGEVAAVFSWAELGPDDAILGVLPLFHVLSQMANLLLPLVKGTRVVYLETLNTTELLRALRERGISAFAVVPQFFYLIHERIFKEAAKKGAAVQKILRLLMRLNRTLRKLGFNAGPYFFGKIHQTFGSKMRYLVTGGSRFDPQIAREFYDLGIDVLQAYGLTETSGGAFVNKRDDIVIGSVGPPLAGVEGKILNPQPQDEGPAIGEIAIRGAIVMKGYWNRPDATDAVLKAGWLHTGDLGYFDSGSNLFITGRSKEVIVLSNGKNVYPEEIEAHYGQSPFIKEIAVMGLEGAPGDPASERLHAVVVPNFEAMKERKVVNAKEVIRFDIESLSAQIASTKRIGSYEIWQEDLPRTTTRKLKRFEIEKRVRTNGAGKSADADLSTQKPLSEEEQSWLQEPDVQRALEVLGSAASNGSKAIRPNDNLELDLGFDSMQRVEALVALEQELGGNVEESRLADVYTVRSLVDLVRESASSGHQRSPAQFAGWGAILKETPSDPDVLGLAKAHPFKDVLWLVVSRMIRMYANDRFHLRVTGIENLPPRGPFIISSNHQSYLDPAILTGILPAPILRSGFAVGTSEIFGSSFMRRLARWLRVIVVDPDANLMPAMRAGAFGLRQGRVLVLYPEGERSIDGTPRIFKKGAAILSIHLQVPIVPVAIEGFFDAWPRGKSFQGHKPLKMAIGAPIFPPPESAASEEAYTKLTADLKARVVEMWEALRKPR